MSGLKDRKYFLNNKHFYSFREVLNYYYIEDQSLDSFKAFLKKCPNITSIKFNRNFQWDRNFNRDKINEVFGLIIENCINLSETNFLHHINDNNFKEFQRKFGPKIKYLESFKKLNDLSLFPNIEKVTLSHAYQHTIISQLKLANLKNLELEIDQGQESMLKTFIDTFPTLTHLNVVVDSEDKNAIFTLNPVKIINNWVFY